MGKMKRGLRKERKRGRKKSGWKDERRKRMLEEKVRKRGKERQ